MTLLCWAQLISLTLCHLFLPLPLSLTPLLCAKVGVCAPSPGFGSSSDECVSSVGDAKKSVFFLFLSQKWQPPLVPFVMPWLWSGAIKGPRQALWLSESKGHVSCRYFLWKEPYLQPMWSFQPLLSACMWGTASTYLPFQRRPCGPVSVVGSG